MTDLYISLLNLGSKLLIYLCSAMLIGGWFILLIHVENSRLGGFVRRWMVVGAMIGLFAVGVNFYAQVGTFAESGWAGLFDSDYQLMLWDSLVGNSVMLRLLGFGLALITLLLLRFAPRPVNPDSSLRAWGTLMLFFISALLLSSAFVLTGHTVEQDLLIRFLLGIHVFIALLWMGALVPLFYACGIMEAKPLQQLMQRFGLLAMGLVAVLLACGVAIAWQLLAHPTELVGSAYGRMLLLKMLLVVMILGLAALHKLHFVPQLTDKAAAMKLKRSVLIEIILGIAILAITVLLTTALGPESMH